MLWGNKPTDGGHLSLTAAERAELLHASPAAARFVRPYYGAAEYIRGLQRFCIWVEDHEAEAAARMPQLKARFDQVRALRRVSKAAETRPAAAYPHRFRQIQGIAEGRSFIVPQVSSESREFLPVGLLPTRAIVSNLAFALYDAPFWNMALIASRLHLVWIATVCGKLETRYRYSNSRTPREERIIAGFEEIQRFVAEHGRPPQHGEERDIFERLYAVRLDRLRKLDDARTLLAPLDHQGLLSAGPLEGKSIPDDIDDDELLSQLGVDVPAAAGITDLRHVRTAAEKREAEEIANRDRCEDFDRFKPLFDSVQKELAAGLRQTKRFERKSEITVGRFYILGGQKAYVAAMEQPLANEHGNVDARLRVIFDNGTESNLLMRSLQKALQQDPTGRRIVEPSAGPLFKDQNEEGDEASGTVYVLRSKSEHPVVAAHRGVLHKIGVTGGDVARRIANARLDPTFLMADVEVVATYELFNINRTRLENLIHRIFDPGRLDIEIKDRFGNPVLPREWFLVPLFAVDEAVEKIKDGTITSYAYDPKTARLQRR